MQELRSENPPPQKVKMRAWRAADASANLMKERRLAFVAREKSLQDRAVRNEEQRLSRTQDALGKLGAGKQYGEA